MECNVTKQAVSVNDIVYDGAVEQSLECDIVLPDYCPDIVKILKCELSCAVTSAQPEGPVLQLEGLAVTDFSPLAAMPALRTVVVPADQGPAVEAACPGYTFELRTY